MFALDKFERMFYTYPHRTFILNTKGGAVKRKTKELKVATGDIDLARHFYAMMMGGGLIDFGTGDSVRAETRCPAEVRKSEFSGALNNLRASIRARQSS